jgi:hypothetical protein
MSFKAIEVRGVTYRSHKEAARHLGIGISTLHRAKTQGRLDEVGLPRKPGGRPGIPTRVNGILYPSRTAAANATGRHRGRLSRQKQGDNDGDL